MSVLVIGYGNPLREDDGVGCVAAESLAAESFGAAFASETIHQLLPELAEPVSAADFVIFIDAAVEGQPGQVTEYTVLPRPAAPGALNHHLDPAGLLDLAASLYGRCPPARMFTVTAARLGYREGLSPEVAAALPELLARVRLAIEPEAANAELLA